MAKAGTATAVSEPTNGAEQTINSGIPYIALVTIEGNADLLFHAWNVEAIQQKADSKKGSKEKKTDNVESYVYRNEDGLICLPSEYLRMSIVNAAKFRQDPRSPRKSAMDLYKAGIVSLEPLCKMTPAHKDAPKAWDYEHKCRVTVQRAGLTRTRPAFRAGWSVTIPLMVLVPEYISAHDLHETISQAGRLVGVGDFRPTYGRYQVTKFEIQKDDAS